MGKKRKPALSAEFAEFFQNFDTNKFPKYNPPPEKSLKERKLEQEQERETAIKAHEKRFATGKPILDSVFMRRNVEDYGANWDEPFFATNIFREDVDSYKKVISQHDHRIIGEYCPSNFEKLHAKQRKVTWHERERQAFKKSSKILERFMDNKDLARAANAQKRIAKGESANLNIPRYSAEMVKQRMKTEKDLFGHFSLVPHTLTKSNKSAIERKQLLIDRFSSLIPHFDYSTRPGCREKEMYVSIQREMKKLKSFLDAPSLPKKAIRSSSVPAKKDRAQTKEVQKQKMKGNQIPEVAVFKKREKDQQSSFEIAEQVDERTEQKQNMVNKTDCEVVIPKRVEKEQRLGLENRERISGNQEEVRKERKRKGVDDQGSDIVVLKKIGKEQRSSSEVPKEKINAENEEKKRDFERRRLAVQKREQERLEKRKKEEEELQKRNAEELEEATRRKEERIRLETEEARKKEERRKEEEEARSRKMEEERKKENERQLRKKAEELEAIKRNIEAAKKNVQVVPSIDEHAAPEIVPTLLHAWNVGKCRMPRNWTERKTKFFNRFNWPVDELQRDVERMELKRDRRIIIPQENTINTVSYSLRMPVKALQTKKVSVVKQISVVKPVRFDRVSANLKLTEEVVNELKKLMNPSQKNIARLISLRTQEVDYRGVSLKTLQSSILYPFYFSDGMYWPVFYALQDNSNIGHVEALTVCNSFSGKYASHHLLTTSLQDDDSIKKFEEAYTESDGDWADYSQKAGRFSSRIGFKAHHNQCKDTFDTQKQRAVAKLNQQYQHEREEADAFGIYMAGERRDYKERLTIHLRELVRDARLDKYSVKESFQDIEDGVSDHPGTRSTPLDLSWHSHGYKIYLGTRDRDFGLFMQRACQKYENMLPPRGCHDEFNDWCFAPMLASLYYQSNYKPFDCFSRSDMKKLKERHNKYLALISKERKFSLKQARELCKLTPIDKKQWTFLHDQIASHFRDFPAIFNLMFDKKLQMIPRVDKAIESLMRTIFRERANNWTKFKDRYPDL